jgi:Xaa-Pro aminopeptidase
VAAELGGRLRIVAGRDLLRDIRMVKTPTEIAHIRAATRKTELALLTSAEAIAGGANCADAERVFWSTAALMGGRPVFLLITPYRPKVGRLQKTDALLPGDTVTFDATAEYAHYTSDIGRTAVIGEPNRDQLRCYNATRLGWRAGQAGFRPGAWSKDVEQGVTRCIQEAGNPEFRACGIHSVGLEHTDHPHPNGDASPFHLIDGMVISCDLPWIGPDTGKFHFEDLVYLHDGQVETLNDSDGRLIVCCDGRASRVE